MPWQCFVATDKADRKTPGAMFEWKGLQFVTLPNGQHFHIHRLSSDGTPWTVTGDVPNITMNPSINYLDMRKDDGTLLVKGWHGWLQNGVLTDDCEGRTYP